MINGFPFLSEARDGRRKSPALEEAGRRFSKPADLQIHVWSFPKTHTHTHTHNMKTDKTPGHHSWASASESLDIELMNLYFSKKVPAYSVTARVGLIRVSKIPSNSESLTNVVEHQLCAEFVTGKNGVDTLREAGCKKIW